MIKTVIFDIGNVLMTFEYGSYVKELLKDDDLIERVNDAIWKDGYWDELDLGHDPETVFSKMLAAGPNEAAEIRMVLDNISQCLGSAEYAKPWIKELKTQGYQVLFLSNYSEFIMEAGPEVLDFLPLMDGGIFSCHVGMIKPDPGIYQAICEKYELLPSECVFVDDNQENIKAADMFGLNTVRFMNYPQAKKELELLLDNTSEKASELSFQTTDDWRGFRQLNEHCREPDFV